MIVRYQGELGFGVTAKDLILGTIGQMGVDGGVGHVIEFSGDVIKGLSMEGRMTICNMTIEGGGRAGMIAPDETTFEWLEGRPAAPDDFEQAVAQWRELYTEDGATFDKEVKVDAGALSPQVT
jgi:3-isopropylmalate/(R)-2-methylmalate dehydratase large subunit